MIPSNSKSFSENVQFLGIVQNKEKTAQPQGRFRMEGRTYLITLKIKDHDAHTLTEQDWRFVADKVGVMLQKKGIFKSKQTRAARIDSKHVKPATVSMTPALDKIYSHDHGIRTREDYNELMDHLFKRSIPPSIPKPSQNKTPSLPSKPSSANPSPELGPVDTPLSPTPVTLPTVPTNKGPSPIIMSQKQLGQQMMASKMDGVAQHSSPFASSPDSGAIVPYDDKSPEINTNRSSSFKMADTVRDFIKNQSRPYFASSKTSEEGAIVSYNQPVNEQSEKLNPSKAVLRINLGKNNAIILTEEGLEKILASQTEFDQFVSLLRKAAQNQLPKIEEMTKELSLSETAEPYSSELVQFESPSIDLSTLIKIIDDHQIKSPQDLRDFLEENRLVFSPQQYNSLLTSIKTEKLIHFSQPHIAGEEDKAEAATPLSEKHVEASHPDQTQRIEQAIVPYNPKEFPLPVSTLIERARLANRALVAKMALIPLIVALIGLEIQKRIPPPSSNQGPASDQATKKPEGWAESQTGSTQKDGEIKESEPVAAVSRRRGKKIHLRRPRGKREPHYQARLKRIREKLITEKMPAEELEAKPMAPPAQTKPQLQVEEPLIKMPEKIDTSKLFPIPTFRDYQRYYNRYTTWASIREARVPAQEATPPAPQDETSPTTRRTGVSTLPAGLPKPSFPRKTGILKRLFKF